MNSWKKGLLNVELLNQETKRPYDTLATTKVIAINRKLNLWQL